MPGLSKRVAKQFLAQESAGLPTRQTAPQLQGTLQSATENKGSMSTNVAKRARADLAPDSVGRDVLNTEDNDFA
jgi:hypothetical protein